MKFVTKGQYATNIGARVYLLDSDTKYYMFKPKGMEFTFDVDVSGLPCGLNGALYFSEMEADGGMGKNSGNKCGAKYGTGYCDAQCPHDMKFINGEVILCFFLNPICRYLSFSLFTHRPMSRDGSPPKMM
jgi:cellulose 1,4-beta-cellobiosidase